MQALGKYKEVHKTNPENIECLKYLVHLCTEMGRRPEAQEYHTKLNKAVKMANSEATATAAATQQRQQQQQAGGDGGENSGGGRGGGGGGQGMGMGMGSDLMGGMDESNIGGLGANIPRSTGRKMVVKEKAEAKDSDEWGNGGLGDDLLPM